MEQDGELFNKDMLDVIKHELSLFKNQILEIDQKCNQVLGINSDMKIEVEKQETKVMDINAKIKDLYSLNLENTDKFKGLDFKFKKFELAKDDQINNIQKKQAFLDQVFEKVTKLESEKASNVSVKRIEDKLWFETPSNEKFEKAVEEIHQKINEDIDTLKTFTKKMERFRLDQTRLNDRNAKAESERQDEMDFIKSKQAK